ncbi:MAG: hypothetical protein HGJ92_14030 [Desulfobacteraceae bacterium]|nr:hypothetical protein [Desulfobacteraceae bacterium]
MKKAFPLKLNCFKYFPSFILVLLFVFSADFSFAHRVVLFAWIEGDTVFTQSQFPDGKKIADGQVHVFDMNHNLLIKGKTDLNGEFSFKIPKTTALNIVLDAGMGHQGQWKLSEDEINASMGIRTQKPVSEKNEHPADKAAASQKLQSESLTAADNRNGSGTAVLLDEKQVEQIVEKVLDKKLQPITRMLARMQNTGPSINDIFGGIGYILGLMGVAAYFLSRKKG